MSTPAGSAAASALNTYLRGRPFPISRGTWTVQFSESRATSAFVVSSNAGASAMWDRLHTTYRTQGATFVTFIKRGR